MMDFLGKNHHLGIILDNFYRKGGPLPKKYSNFFSQSGMTIHAPIESPNRVDKKYVVFKNVYLDIWPKEAKKERKNTNVFIHVFKNQVWA